MKTSLVNINKIVFPVLNLSGCNKAGVRRKSRDFQITFLLTSLQGFCFPLYYQRLPLACPESKEKQEWFFIYENDSVEASDQLLFGRFRSDASQSRDQTICMSRDEMGHVMRSEVLPLSAGRKIIFSSYISFNNIKDFCILMFY